MPHALDPSEYSAATKHAQRSIGFESNTARDGQLGPDFSERAKHKQSQHYGYQMMITYVTSILASVADGISMKVLKIGIASYEQMKARTLAITRGELKTETK